MQGTSLLTSHEPIGNWRQTKRARQQGETLKGIVPGHADLTLSKTANLGITEGKYLASLLKIATVTLRLLRNKHEGRH